MERIWLKNYPPGVPHDVDPNQYSSLTDLMETAFRDHADNPFSVCMERWMTFRELDALSRAMGRGCKTKGWSPAAGLRSCCLTCRNLP